MSEALATLTAVVLGGGITILGQFSMDVLRERHSRRARDRQVRAAVRVIRFQFFCTEHLIKHSIETEHWWGTSKDHVLVAPGSSIEVLSELLPEAEWRIYTGAWRRLADLRDIAAELDRMAHPSTTHDHVQRLLGAFVTVDDARHRLERFGLDRSTQSLRIEHLGLTEKETKQAFARYAGHLVDQERWIGELRPAIQPSPSPGRL